MAAMASSAVLGMLEMVLPRGAWGGYVQWGGMKYSPQQALSSIIVYYRSIIYTMVYSYDGVLHL